MTTTLITTENTASSPHEGILWGGDAAISSTGFSGGFPLFVPRDELFFWTRAWQAGEAESAAERAAGNLRTFDDPNDLLRWLLTPED